MAPNSENRASRQEQLRQILLEHRQKILAEIEEMKRGLRAEGELGNRQGKFKRNELSEAADQEDIALAVYELKHEMLIKVEDALKRLDRGEFGTCFECGDEISERRLRALPFAIRCKDCEVDREKAVALGSQNNRRKW